MQIKKTKLYLLLMASLSLINSGIVYADEHSHAGHNHQHGHTHKHEHEHEHKHKQQHNTESTEPQASNDSNEQINSQIEQDDWDDEAVKKQQNTKKADIEVVSSRPKAAVTATQKVIGGTELVVKSSNSLGESLNAQLGFHASSYGQAAARPVIRGMEGARVRILNNGTELLDASGMGHDHAVAIEPLLADKIEFSRGPNDLAYGGGATGGVVNVLDNRIPSYVPEKPEGTAQVEAGSASQENVFAASLTVGLGDFAFHIDGLDRKSQNYHVGRDWYQTRKIRQPYMPPGAGPDPVWDTFTITEEKAKVPASYNGTDTFGIGGSYVFENGYLGMSYVKQHNHYGIPGHSHPFNYCVIATTRDHLICEDVPDFVVPHSHASGANIRMDSNRWEVRGEMREVSDTISKLSANLNLTDYKHTEYDGYDENTQFKNKGFDSRFELEHQPIFWDVKGVLGAQIFQRKFTVLGEEKGYVAPTTTDKYAVYWLAEKQLDPKLKLNTGVRYDYQQIKVFSPQPDSKHYGLSATISGAWQYHPEHAVTLSYVHNLRTPSSEELYADGIHFAAGFWELGDPYLKNEEANNFDLVFDGKLNELGTSYSVTFYHNYIQNYIYTRVLDYYDFSGPLLQYSQDSASFNGFEVELKQMFDNGLGFRVFSDYVSAKLHKANENVPRLAPLRYGTTFYASKNNWLTEIELYRVAKQTKIAPYETETAAYNMLNAKFSYNVTTAYGDLQFYAKANNLINNKVIYSHTSVVKEQAPLVGRNISLGAKLVF